jgi:hypothetical protein
MNVVKCDFEIGALKIVFIILFSVFTKYKLHQLLLWFSLKLKHKIAMVNAVAIDV